MSNDQRLKLTRPQVYQAHMMTRAAIQSGELIPRPCVDCRHEPTEAHHPDYKNPLDVIWLCRPCHNRRHLVTRRLERGEPIMKRSLPIGAFKAPKRDQLLDQALALRDQGLSYRSIATGLNVGVGTVYKWLNPKPEYN